MNDISIFILRIIPGVTMAIMHGWGKMVGIVNFLSGKEWKFVNTVANIGFPLPGFFAILAGLTEFLASILLILGLFTRVNAGLLSFVMLVAIYYNIRTGNPYELPLLYMVIFISLILTGGGKYSLDNYVYRKASK